MPQESGMQHLQNNLDSRAGFELTESPQSVEWPFKNLTLMSEPVQNSLNGPESVCQKAPQSLRMEDEFIGVLDVFVFQARDIHNICIYHKQDVYAKLCLTSEPESAVSTKIINGGGQSPVFNDNVKLNVRKVQCSLKCEIWMMSRVRNYLEDQLLGFALVPLSEIFTKKGKVEKEFTLSSTDLFPSPAGYVKLGITFNGDIPETIHPVEDSETPATLPDLDKIEFPDPVIQTENDLMVSEYFEISKMGSLSSEVSSSGRDEVQKVSSPQTSVLTNGSLEVESRLHEQCEEKERVDGDGESVSSGGGVVSVRIEPEKKMVKQEFVDLYMKSMQQFTVSLAKMKLPLDLEKDETADSGTDQKCVVEKSGGSRLFYGSRAFF